MKLSMETDAKWGGMLWLYTPSHDINKEDNG